MTFDNRIGEAERLQQEINQHRPLGRPILRQLNEYFRVGLTWASNALEGNSLTETETKVVIEDGITIGGKPVDIVVTAESSPYRSISPITH